MQMINIVFASSSFVTFIFGLASVLINWCCYFRYKNKYEVDPTERIFFIALVVITAFEFMESFQWFLLLKISIPCTVLGAVREYAMISLLVTLICLGIHLCIIMIHPKCLKVIKEEKQRRHTLLQRSYIFATFTIPLLFVPWPFIEMGYGKDEYLCWLASNQPCNFSDRSVPLLIVHLLMWHFWAILAWMFAVAVVVVAIYRYCMHKSASNVTTSIHSHNVCAIIPMLLTFIIIFIANGFLFIWELIIGKFSYPASLQAAVLTPLMLLVYALIINIRQVRITMLKSQRIVTNAFTSSATRGKSYGTSSQTHFILPVDEWD